ncbi:amyloid-beta A4 protein-like isoform X2 [Pecten maximus]|uniref:amyloid-beta A4 protein-like isoform X2 n=1 Tax=Pecten maximus TaxID=6579 RepID=UPI0014589000|nr:amyloid-beta A4 protein-like isoform X2 [Pecten maximus]
MFFRVVIFACLLQTAVCPAVQVQDEERYFCPTPGEPAHATIEGTDYEMGSYIIVQCDPGYFLTGMMKIYCVALPNPFKKMAGWENVVGQNPECHPMSPTDQPKRDNLSIRKMHDRQNRSPDLLVDMGEPKMLKDDFADIFEKEPEREAVSTMNTKLVYANELKDRKKSKIEDFVITPLKYKSHTFHLKKGKAACSLDKFTGPCRSRKTRYFYNIRTEECEEFIYGGCRGNGNNFLSKADCEDACAK